MLSVITKKGFSPYNGVYHDTTTDGEGMGTEVVHPDSLSRVHACTQSPWP